MVQHGPVPATTLRNGGETDPKERNTTKAKPREIQRILKSPSRFAQAEILELDLGKL